MEITPWNWVWTVFTVALVLTAVPRTKVRGFLPVFVASAAVAAALAWSGVGESWHLAVFPALPLVLLAATTSWRQRVVSSSSPAVTVPFGKPREIETRAAPSAHPRRMAIWSPLLWVPAAVVAIALLALGVTAIWLIAIVFPLASLVAIVATREGPLVASERWNPVLVATPAIALIAAIVAAPDAPVSAPTTTTTTSPVVTTVLMVEAIFVDVHGSQAQPDGTMLVVPVSGAWAVLRRSTGSSLSWLCFALQPGRLNPPSEHLNNQHSYWLSAG